MQQSVLITGGAGFLGINLCRHLLRSGARLRSVDIAPFDYPERHAIEIMRADIRDANAMDRALLGIDVVVHCAAALPRAPAAEIHSTNVEGTRLLLARAENAGVRRFIFISSTAVYGIPRHEPIVETDLLHGVGPYGESKILGEQSCMQARTGDLCVTVLRPKTFVGPERLGVFELLYQWAYEGRNFPVLGSGDNLYQLLDVEDLCEVIERCCRVDSAIAQDTFNVGAQQFSTMRENFQAVLDRAGHGGRVVSLPKAPAVFALRLLQMLHLSPLYPWVYDTAGQESWVSIERLQQRLHFKPQFSNRAALIRNYDWYAAHRAEFTGKSGRTHRLPWRHGLLELAKYAF